MTYERKIESLCQDPCPTELESEPCQSTMTQLKHFHLLIVLIKLDLLYKYLVCICFGALVPPFPFLKTGGTRWAGIVVW